MVSRSSLFVGVATVVAVASSAACYLVRDPRPWFADRRAGQLAVRLDTAIVSDGSVLQGVRLTAASGLEVDVMLRRAIGDTGKRVPTAVILGGHVRGREAALLVGETPGVAVAAVSYPFGGDPRPSRLEVLRQLPIIRRAFLDTPPAILLALDYLHSRPDVDTTRIEAIGVSLGAPFVTIAGALDPRISRVWAIHGSGGSFAPLEANMKKAIGFAPLRTLAAALANVIIAGPRMAPEQWAGRIAPRPFIMVNARDDERMPIASVHRLYDAAAEPKELIWMDGGHVHGDAPTIQRLVEIVLSRIGRTDVALLP
jgi:hypothetical protein